MQHRGYKMIYIISGIFGILIVFFMIKGCAYPTSYRAFIPKALDSEYKEYQRLCKEEIGKVVYARPVGEGARVEDIHFSFPNSLVSDSIRLNIVSVSDGKKIIYIISSSKTSPLSLLFPTFKKLHNLSYVLLPYLISQPLAPSYTTHSKNH